MKSSDIFENYSIPKEWDIFEPVQQQTYLCNKELLKWNGKMQKVFSPIFEKNGENSIQKYIGSYPLMGKDETMKVLDAAQSAYDKGRAKWPTMSIDERISCIETFTNIMIKKRKDVVKLLMWEIGKSLEDSKKEFERTVDYIRDTINALKELDRDSSKFKVEEGVLAQIRRSPLGVVLCMGPYNYPLNETFTTLIPALIMGNTVIFKPPKIGVLLHEPLLEAFRDAFPKGVINTVYGTGHEVVEPLMNSGRIDVLAFIGTSKGADAIKKQHPKPHRLRSVLGLEAKNAAIVLADADLDNAVSECVSGSLSYNGQRCTALKILFIHRSIEEKFLKNFLKQVDDLKQGLPWEDGVKITPLPDTQKIAYQFELIEDAVKKGAKVINKEVESCGTFMSPVVVYGVTKAMRLYHEEQFGPVVPIVVFDDVDVAMDYVVESNYGQQVSLFGNDSSEIGAMIDPLVNQVCRVNINSQCQRGPDSFPFTGRKDSAEGTLSVSDALRVFSIRTLVAAKTNDQNKDIIQKIVTERSSRFLSTDFIF